MAPNAPQVEVAPKRRFTALWLWAASFGVCAASFAVGWRVHESSVVRSPEWKVTRLTTVKGIPPDGKKVVVFGGGPLHIDLVDVETHEQTPLVTHQTFNMVLGRISSDGRWISFTARMKANKAMIAVAPIDGPHPVPESAWIEISEEGPEDRAAWSPWKNPLFHITKRWA